MQFTITKPLAIDGTHYKPGDVLDEANIPTGARYSLRMLDATDPPVPIDNEFAISVVEATNETPPDASTDTPAPAETPPTPVKSKK